MTGNELKNGIKRSLENLFEKYDRTLTLTLEEKTTFKKFIFYQYGLLKTKKTEFNYAPKTIVGTAFYFLGLESCESLSEMIHISQETISRCIKDVIPEIYTKVIGEQMNNNDLSTLNRNISYFFKTDSYKNLRKTMI